MSLSKEYLATNNNPEKAYRLYMHSHAVAINQFQMEIIFFFFFSLVTKLTMSL
jgi:hypothetical protein